MAFFRIHKTSNYTVMCNHHLQDTNLSLKAIGLLSKMLSLPNKWDFSLKGLVAICKEGEDAIRSALKELEDNKYLKRIRYNDPVTHQFRYEYNIYEMPYTVFQYMEDKHADNQLQLNTNELNNDKIDKTNHQITEELIKRKFISKDDLDIYKYNNLFENVLNEYDYMDVVVCCNYILSKWKKNNGLDENDDEIENKFAYFRASLLNNLNRKNIEIDWLNDDISLD